MDEGLSREGQFVASVAMQAASGIQQIIAAETDAKTDVLVIVYSQGGGQDAAALGAATVALDPAGMREAVREALEAAYEKVLSRPPDKAGRRRG